MADPAVPAAPPSPAQPPAPSSEPLPFTAAPVQSPASMSPLTGANYAAQLLNNLGGQPPPPTQPPQMVPPAPPVVPVPQAPAFPVQAPVVPLAPVAPAPFVPTPAVPVQPAQPAQPVQPERPAVADRYAAPVQTDPLADLQPMPALAAEQQIADPQFTSDQQNHAWAALRAQSKANRKMAEEAQRKYNELVESTKGFQNEKTEFANQLNVKDQQISQLQDELGKLDLARSPAFRAKYDAKLDAQHAQIMDVLEKNGIAKEAAFDLARDVIVSDPKDIPNMIGQLPTYAQGEIMVFANQAGNILAERERELGDWRNAQQGLEAVAAREGSVQTAQHIQQAADKAIEAFRALTPETGLAPSYRVLDPKFVASRDEKEQQFKQWVGRASEQDRYMAMLEGFMAPKTYEMLDQVMRENEALKRQFQSRGRISAPPVAPAAYEPPPPPAPPQPQQPAETVNGFGRADVGGAQNYAQAMLSNLFGQPPQPMQQ